MMSKRTTLMLAALLVLVAAGSRFLPHAWNMTPITAIALFASVYLGVRYSLLIVAAAMFVSDIFIGFYDWRVMLSVYAGFAGAGLIGLLLRKRKTAVNVVLGAASSSVFFFLLTNWAVWQFGAMYQQTLAGLMQSYAMGLPFFRNMLFGDIAYTGVLFGAFELAARFSPKFRLAIMPADRNTAIAAGN